MTPSIGMGGTKMALACTTSLAPDRPLHQSVIEGDGIPPLLSLEFDARPRGRAESAARRSRGKCSRRDERIHVHWLYARHASILHESKSRSPRRFHRIFCRD